MRVQVVKRQRDNGTEYNEVKRFDVLRREENPFAPDLTQNPEVATKSTDTSQNRNTFGL